MPWELPGRVRVVEVGPRDGLQHEAKTLSTAEKISFIDSLSVSGLKNIEVSSFVSPKWIPALADASEVFAGIKRQNGVTYSALVPNPKGYQRAREAGAGEVAVFVSASQTHNHKNLNVSTAAQLENIEAVARSARDDGVPVRGYLSTAFGCPYEGEVDPTRVAELAANLIDQGCYEVSLGDTTGVANPILVRCLVELVAGRIGIDRLALHFHDTRGLGLVNVMAGLDSGVTVYDASAGGLGGCPYAPGASGNIATEDLIYLLHSLGIETGVNLDRLCRAARQAGRALDMELPSRYNRACGAVRG